MNSKIQELISLLENNEVEFIDTTDRRAINISVKYKSKKIFCCGVIVPKEHYTDICDYNWDKGLGLYLKEEKNE